MNQAQRKIESYAEDVAETQTNQFPRKLEVVPRTWQEEFAQIQREGNQEAKEARRHEREELILPIIRLMAMSGPLGYAGVVTLSPVITAWINSD